MRATMLDNEIRSVGRSIMTRNGFETEAKVINQSFLFLRKKERE